MARDRTLRFPTGEVVYRSPAPPSFAAYLAVRGEAGRIVVVPTAEVELLEAAAKWVEVHVGEATWLARGPLHELERLLDPAHFVRVSRSAIVALARVREIRSALGRFTITLASGRRVVSGSTYHGRLRDFVANRAR